MPEAISGGLSIHYDTFGDAGSPAVLLIMGLGTQMTAWRPELCRALADRGLFVIRYDNRDIGLSTKVHGAPLPSIPRTLLRRSLGLARSAYTLSDMAKDGVAVLDTLGVESAHVVGASMGGMIAQTIAIEHAPRVRSLTSIMSTTGDPRLSWPSAAARTVLLRPGARSRAEAIDNVVSLFRVIGSPRYFDEAKVRDRAGESYDRSSYRVGVARQLDAILCARPRGAALARLRVPTTVLHGALDPLVRVDHGRATAHAIPGAELRVVHDMAHDLPDALWPTFVDAVARSVERAS